MTPSAEPAISSRTHERVAALIIAVAAVLAYFSTLGNYFVRDDFGVVQLLASKPAAYFPRWFYTSWMDQIWGFTPDEVRPFPALSYQLSALAGAGSPWLHHVFNVILHIANGLLVLAIARTLTMSVPAAGLAGLLFVLLPVHAESVAWITGRVDSMPALFYLASFLAYARWRRGGSTSHALYGWSLALFFVALFTKQNTITMVATLAAYDVIVLRQPWTPIARFVAPYVPFAALTAGYLWLRLQLFGEVAREGALTAEGLVQFATLVERHLAHVITGDADGWRAVVVLALLGLIWVLRLARSDERRLILYFGPVWWFIGVAPILVAGYSSPRHVYLAAVGWALVVAIAFDVLMTRARVASLQRLVISAALVVLTAYLLPLHRAVRDWNTMAAVSQRAVQDVRAIADVLPEGSLIVVGAPTRSWEWAMPFAVQPPFVDADLTTRFVFISPRSLTCCRGRWFEDTRAALRRWSEGPQPDSAVAMTWDPETGALSRAQPAASPQLAPLIRALLTLESPDDLDRNLVRLLGVLPTKVE